MQKKVAKDKVDCDRTLFSFLEYIGSKCSTFSPQQFVDDPDHNDGLLVDFLNVLSITSAQCWAWKVHLLLKIKSGLAIITKTVSIAVTELQP